MYFYIYSIEKKKKSNPHIFLNNLKTSFSKHLRIELIILLDTLNFFIEMKTKKKMVRKQYRQLLVNEYLLTSKNKFNFCTVTIIFYGN